jgi:ABC-type bacteriocin/lantibiotic exporter with double-glycine peptidase domain
MKSSKPPFVAQERADTCALACLRMLLAHRGRNVSEAALIQEVSHWEGGLDPDQLSQLAQRHGFRAEAQKLDVDGIAALVASERFPIVLVDRTVLDDEFAIHAVIPVRFTKHYVTLLDPLRGERRVSIRRFVLAQRRVGGWAVAWEPAQ